MAWPSRSPLRQTHRPKSGEGGRSRWASEDGLGTAYGRCDFGNAAGRRWLRLIPRGFRWTRRKDVRVLLGWRWGASGGKKQRGPIAKFLPTLARRWRIGKLRPGNVGDPRSVVPVHQPNRAARRAAPRDDHKSSAFARKVPHYSVCTKKEEAPSGQRRPTIRALEATADLARGGAANCTGGRLAHQNVKPEHQPQTVVVEHSEGVVDTVPTTTSLSQSSNEAPSSEHAAGRLGAKSSSQSQPWVHAIAGNDRSEAAAIVTPAPIERRRRAVEGRDGLRVMVGSGLIRDHSKQCPCQPLFAGIIC